MRSLMTSVKEINLSYLIRYYEFPVFLHLTNLLANVQSLFVMRYFRFDFLNTQKSCLSSCSAIFHFVCLFLPSIHPSNCYIDFIDRPIYVDLYETKFAHIYLEIQLLSSNFLLFVSEISLRS